MEMKKHFDHFNFNVTNLGRSIDFYAQALDLKEVGRIADPDGRFVIVYLGDGTTDFRLELTELADHRHNYDLGEGEFHLCLRVGDYEKVKEHHRQMGCICFENKEMGLYFIEDPDGYWIEILPERK